ncbi:MAG: divergent PAP2 family protein [bacterium]
MQRETIPIWGMVLLCGIIAQMCKLLIYSLLQKRLALSVLGQSVGLPSLHAAVLSCMTVLLTIESGWHATATSLALVFTVIVVHDTIRLKGENLQQRIVLHELIDNLAADSAFQRRIATLLTVRAHQPFHVAIGALFGLLFALAFGLPPT